MGYPKRDPNLEKWGGAHAHKESPLPGAKHSKERHVAPDGQLLSSAKLFGILGDECEVEV